MKLQAGDTLTGHRTRESVRTKLARIAQRACKDENAKFNSLAHLMCKSTLQEAFRRVVKSAAPGIDGETKESYAENLDENLDNLLKRLKTDSFKPKPVRRKYITKLGSDKKRPLGIPALEDKIVQITLVIILESIYEQDFLYFSFGFRPYRSCHDALKHLSKNIGTKKVNFIVDADIKGFFDHVDHEWMMRFLQHRISDSKILRLIKRFLKAGVMEDGIIYKGKEGVPQGGNLSPLLANVYLHYVLDLWVERSVKRGCMGEVY
ncbi:MAG: group II intron reverse transcriptase/maturase, partial [Halanaerobiales bacterium]|nr:group II intron reverse transcriptase/maturase [Halanaerobiales bacterium]